MSGWIGVDLDGCLAHYDGWQGVDDIGEPIPAMVSRVKRWLADGQDVRIFTARIHGHMALDIKTGKPVDALTPIRDWCLKHIGTELPVTNIKDFRMTTLYDDRCVQVEHNTGKLIHGGEWK